MESPRPRLVSREAVLTGLRRDRAASVPFAALWTLGSLASLETIDRRTIAIVGSRAPSAAAQARARELGRTLARAGVVVVSGLAVGIDEAAHRGALDGGGTTIGVLGGGHDRFFPARNRALANAMIASGGAVVSPYAPEEPARPFQFLERNGVVAALSDAIVIVEAATRSGALNTAGWGAKLGVDVLVFPGDVDRPKAAGCNALIRDGATLVRDAADVFEALGVKAPATPRSASRGPGADGGRSESDPLGRTLLRALREERALDLDRLVATSGAAAGEVVATLVRLELEGRVERPGAGTFALVRSRGG